MKAQPRSRWWIFASVAALLLLGLSLNQLDTHKMYQNLQTQLAATGIKLTSSKLQLSAMYFGSIVLSDVEIQSDAFDLSAQRVFIDLDLPALLTGKALAQALYLQGADIDVLHSQEEIWLSLLKTEHFKLKRIHLSQSEIHFDAQHTTLEHVDLDIRDIGKNKNPRLELRANIGEGRLDAFGYLHLKRGEITRGFGRVRLHDIPLQQWLNQPLLQTLDGSVTIHMQQNKRWQAFGHVSALHKQQESFELRGKVTGHQQQFMHIEDMVLNMDGVGAVVLSGDCADTKTCHIKLDSQQLNLTPMLFLWDDTLQDKALTNVKVNQLALEMRWENQTFSSLGHAVWENLDYKGIHFDAGRLEFSGLQRHQADDWSLQQAFLFESKDETEFLQLQDARYQTHHTNLPFIFKHTALWQPVNHLLASVYPAVPKVEGKGRLDGVLEIQISQQKLGKVSVDVDASDAELRWHDYVKPQGIRLQVQGKSQADTDVEQAVYSILLADAYADVSYVAESWKFSHASMNFDDIQGVGVELASPWQQWRGLIAGQWTMQGGLKDGHIVDADVILLDFGMADDLLTGQLALRDGIWFSSDLTWLHGQQPIDIQLHRAGDFTITANQLDTSALLVMQQLPFLRQGKISSGSFVFPFAQLEGFSSRYTEKNETIVLQKVSASLNQGTLYAPWLHIQQRHDIWHYAGRLQVGDVMLNHWTWLQKQFQAHLAGRLYATVNLQADFDHHAKLLSWRGDGDVSVYNGKWLLDQRYIVADMLSLNLRKREQLSTSLYVEHGRDVGQGELRINEQADISGHVMWQAQRINLFNVWPNLQYLP